jgi:hypothetical protein
MGSIKITGANAGGTRRMQIRTLWAARIAQFFRSFNNSSAMKLRQPSHAFIAAAFALVCLMPNWARGSTPVVPTEYRFGPIPYPYVPYNFMAYPYTLGSTADIIDGSLQTFTRVQGLDAVLQSNGAVADTGTFYLLQYKIDPRAVSFTINFTARIDDYPFTPFGDFQIFGLSPDGVTPTQVLSGVTARQPATFGVEFFRDGNSGNFPPSTGFGLDSMMTADGRVRIVLEGGFGAALNQPGALTSYLYEATASYDVPEPSGIALLGLAGLMATGTLYSRRTRAGTMSLNDSR